MIKALAPIILFTYNRPWHTEQTLNALMANDLADQSTLYIYCDGAKENASHKKLQKLNEVRQIVRKKQWCKEVHIIEREKNWGLADNIIDGVTSALDKHGKTIVLEDDIVTSKGFLKYMNDALDIYQNEEQVMHISGFFPPIKSAALPDTFFYNQTSCWGWGTWDRAWQNLNKDTQYLMESIEDVYHFNIDGSYDFYDHLRANIDGRLNTWAIKWHTSVYLKKGLCLHPYPSLVQNIGMDGTGIHSKTDNFFHHDAIADYVKVFKIPLKENESARETIRQFNLRRRGLLYNFIQRIKNLINA